MNFSDPVKVQSVIETLQRADLIRSTNRALVTSQFNGDPPYTRAEADANKIFCNVNWLEGTNILHQAQRQYANAFLKPGQFFNVTLEDAPASKEAEWSHAVTAAINRPLKRSRPYLHTQRSKFAGVTLHGVGPQMWEGPHAWRPYYVGMEDLLIPTDTEQTLDNLTHFARRRRMTPGELFRKTVAKGKHVDKGWRMATVRKVLDFYRDCDANPHRWSWVREPERLAELWKQNQMYYESDAVPVVWLWDFYYMEEPGDGDAPDATPWHHCITLGSEDGLAGIDTNTEFLYKSRRPVASSLSHFLHIQYGDGNNKPPFLHHSTRGLGFLLYNVVSMMNRLRCQFTQHVFEQMMQLLRVADPADRARAEQIVLFHKGVLPDGVSIVPAAERFQVDSALVNQLMSGYKQLVGESASAYTQEIDTGTSKERTKFEVQALVAQTSALLSSMLVLAYEQETYAYREICRRFCLADNRDPDVLRFRADMKRAGVPDAMLDSDRWEIEPEQVNGGGNKMLELAQTREAMSLRPVMEPEAQEEVLHDYLLALTDNAKKAKRWSQRKGPRATDASHDAELAFGTMMASGLPMQVKSGLSHVEQVETLLARMAATIQRIQQTDNMGSMRDLLGLKAVAKYVSDHIAKIAEDKGEKQRVKRYTDALGRMGNLAKGFAQRLSQKMQQANGRPDPELAAKLAGDAALTRQKLASKEVADRQKLASKERASAADEQRKNAATRAEIARGNARTAAELQSDTMLATVEASRAANEPTDDDEGGD
jgi:hypothetical protein